MSFGVNVSSPTVQVWCLVSTDPVTGCFGGWRLIPAALGQSSIYNLNELILLLPKFTYHIPVYLREPRFVCWKTGWCSCVSRCASSVHVWAYSRTDQTVPLALQQFTQPGESSHSSFTFKQLVWFSTELFFTPNKDWVHLLAAWLKYRQKQSLDSCLCAFLHCLLIFKADSQFWLII